jgi:hypothetical protein
MLYIVVYIVVNSIMQRIEQSSQLLTKVKHEICVNNEGCSCSILRATPSLCGNVQKYIFHITNLTGHVPTETLVHNPSAE